MKANILLISFELTKKAGMQQRRAQHAAGAPILHTQCTAAIQGTDSSKGIFHNNNLVQSDRKNGKKNPKIEKQNK